MEKIIISNLKVSKQKCDILNIKSLELKKGSVNCIIGKNGSGKSTLIKSIIGIEKYSGTINVFGKVSDSKVINSIISYVPQESSYNIDISVKEFVSLGLYANKGLLNFPTKAEKTKVMETLKRVGIENLAERSVKSLSGGQRQKTSIAMALVQEKPIIVLDEPTNFLDVETINEIIKIITDLRSEGKTIIMSLHEINHALKISDKIIGLKSGELIIDETPDKSIEKIGELLDVTPIFTEFEGKKIIIDFKNKK